VPAVNIAEKIVVNPLHRGDARLGQNRFAEIGRHAILKTAVQEQQRDIGLRRLVRHAVERIGARVQARIRRDAANRNGRALDLHTIEFDFGTLAEDARGAQRGVDANRRRAIACSRHIVIAADRVDADVRLAQFLELLRDESEFGGRRRFAVKQIATVEKEMCVFGDREINDARERVAQARAALRELLEIHFAVVTTEVVVGAADDANHLT